MSAEDQKDVPLIPKSRFPSQEGINSLSLPSISDRWDLF